jgi:hypothetical protein
MTTILLIRGAFARPRRICSSRQRYLLIATTLFARRGGGIRIGLETVNGSITLKR